VLAQTPKWGLIVKNYASTDGAAHEVLAEITDSVRVAAIFDTLTGKIVPDSVRPKGFLGAMAKARPPRHQPRRPPTTRRWRRDTSHSAHRRRCRSDDPVTQEVLRAYRESNPTTDEPCTWQRRSQRRALPFRWHRSLADRRGAGNPRSRTGDRCMGYLSRAELHGVAASASAGTRRPGRSRAFLRLCDAFVRSAAGGAFRRVGVVRRFLCGSGRALGCFVSGVCV
jgi:hypothetical protein